MGVPRDHGAGERERDGRIIILCLVFVHVNVTSPPRLSITLFFSTKRHSRR